MKQTIILLLAFCVAWPMHAQDQASTRSPILFIYDASGSMWGQLEGQTKIEIATEVLSSTVNNLADDQHIGFVAYGHRREGDCTDVEFLVDMESGTKAEVIQAVEGIKPLGRTPLAYSALLAIDQLRQSQKSATIILITDGIESCDGDLCEVIRAAQAEGIDFKLHIIGFGLKNEDIAPLECAAEAGGGSYFNAEDAGGLGEALDEATNTTVDEPDANFSIYAIKNDVAIDAWVKAYRIGSDQKPIAVRTYQDTGFFYLPPGKYKLDVQPLEGTDVDMMSIPEVESFADSMGHQTISFDGGKLGIETTNNGEYWDCIVKLIYANGKVAASTRTYNAAKEVEVNPGTYKVTIQALRIEGLDTYTEFEDIRIEAGGLTPLSYEFKSGNFDIFTRIGDENIDTIVSLKEVNSGERVDQGRTYARGTQFLLSPGAYEVNVKPLGKHKDKASQTFTVDVVAGELVVKEVKF